MQEFASVSASTHDPSALVLRLEEKAAEGWSVVSIVATGGDVTAFLCRERGAAAPTTSATTSTTAAPTVTAAAAVSEPAGWAVAPEPAATTTSSTAGAVPAQQVPAQWATDPMGRYELRYWDGTRWTEHVARAGQQYTDPL